MTAGLGLEATMAKMPGVLEVVIVGSPGGFLFRCTADESGMMTDVGGKERK